MENTKNGRDPMSIIHSSFWARLYATFAEQSGAHFAVYYNDYPGMKPGDKGSARIPAQAGVFNYKSNFGWRQQPAVAAQTPGSSAEQLLLHCFAFNRTCTVAPPPAPSPGPGRHHRRHRPRRNHSRRGAKPNCMVTAVRLSVMRQAVTRVCVPTGRPWSPSVGS